MIKMETKDINMERILKMESTSPQVRPPDAQKIMPKMA